MNSYKKDIIPMDPISDSSQGLWWGTLVKASSQVNINNPYHHPYQLWGWRNLPDVYPCFCGGHPLPYEPVVQRKLCGYDGVLRPSLYLLSGIPRSGSTVAWQIATLLSKGTISRSHEFTDSCPLFFKYEKVLCTVRHPFDAYFSAIRAFKETGGMNKPMEELYKFRQLQIFQESIGYRPDMHVHFLKYEDFWDDELGKIKHIASLLEIDCDDKRASEILEHTSIDKNKKRSSSEKRDTTRGLKHGGIHSAHVGNLRGKPGQGIDLPVELKKDIIKNHPWVFEHFNYSIEI